MESIGFADPRYGTGYCWEIDYQKRAELAGFETLWIRDAYVHRAYLPEGCSRYQFFDHNTQYLAGKFAGEQLPVEKLDFATLQGLTRPLVSCIMPTWNRRRSIPLAIRYFRRQHYPKLELVIVDDGDEPDQDLEHS